MEFLQDCIIAFFTIVGFIVTVFLAVLYCLDIYVTFVDREDPNDVINQKFEKIIRQ